MPFVLHYNAVADIWIDGQATIPPTDPATTVENVQVLKPWFALNDWQEGFIGRSIFRVIVPIDIFPQDPTNDPNGLGTCIHIQGSGSQFYFNVIGVSPVCSGGEVIGWMCWCANTRYI